ncbi:MAG: UDP-N-acetyl glucosamine 2-epimerase, partial [Actinomycetes bacterium]
AVRCVATGQHSDPRLAADVFAELGCAPDETWSLPRDEASRVGALLSSAYAEMARNPTDALVVLGETYTAPLMAMAARRAGVGVVHVEAGLRSFNERSMEETNRRLLASLATVHLAPTQLAASFLAAEGVDPARVRVVGNPVLDAVRMAGVERRALKDRAGVLVTAHRATNVDDPARLRVLVSVLSGLGERHGPVLFPIHPRTRDRLEANGWWDEVGSLPDVRLSEPLGHVDMLRALAASRLVVTDSGGVQEEASYLGVPVVVMRSTTPRWEGVESSAAVLTGLDRDRVLAAVRRLDRDEELVRVARLECPYGDGHAAAAVVAALAEPDIRALLAPREPELLTCPPVARSA